ncbi:hypothetical protein T12_10481 [Trichinella patagoniensis]|uniref:Uncharacterized protein n=1 Tax=Trichinella patagoniensis TaxID=990121 RepID=A0A0V1A6X0_9BILA|nr:hypothetical protein T12_10481 [Trichinella patagoniensis]
MEYRKEDKSNLNTRAQKLFTVAGEHKTQLNSRAAQTLPKVSERSKKGTTTISTDHRPLSTQQQWNNYSTDQQDLPSPWKRIFFCQLIIGQKVEKNRCNINKKIPLNETRHHERQISFGGKSALSLRQKLIPSSELDFSIYKCNMKNSLQLIPELPLRDKLNASAIISITSVG